MGGQIILIHGWAKDVNTYVNTYGHILHEQKGGLPPFLLKENIYFILAQHS